MQKSVKSIILIAAIAVFLALPVNAATKAINDIIESALEFDGQIVTVEGEAIGEALERGEYSWVNINDGTNAIGIWLKTEDVKKITYYGDYKNVGDKVRITGNFSRDCKEHGGDVDIHVSYFAVVSKGHAVKEEIPLGKVTAAAVLAFITAFAALLYFRKYKKAHAA